MQKESLFVRINGRGNAWPVFLGGKSVFYDSKSSEDLSNAAYSLISCSKDKLTPTHVNWEVLIDAGHHTVPFLIKNGNRLPEAVVLTHGHMDHTLGLDWLAQSVYYQSNKQKRLLVYATKQVWSFVIQSYPHLKDRINYKELRLGESVEIDEAKGLSLTAFPVYHGLYANGAVMLYFQLKDNSSVLFTGDMLCPLLRKKDYALVANSKLVVIDSNNRFPYPYSNHGSIVETNPEGASRSEMLGNWFSNKEIEELLIPHSRENMDAVKSKYFEEFLSDFKSLEELPYSVLEFIKRIAIPNVCLTHYGGMEDVKHHNAPQLSARTLQDWVKLEAAKMKLENHRFIVPEVGAVFRL